MTTSNGVSKNLKIFLVTFLLSLPFWWGIDIIQKSLESFLYQKEISTNPRIVAALAYQEQLKEELENMKPVKNSENYERLEIQARSALSIFVDGEGRERILFQEQIDRELPIASLTKLMTARVALENYDLSDEVGISKEAVQQEENFGKLKVGDSLSVKQLLYPLLMESSNDAAFALAEDYPDMAIEDFVLLMNLEAERLNLSNTYFTNPSGLDPNYSTARDLAKLTEVLMQKPLIWEILSTPRINLYGEELMNTNQLLNYSEGKWWEGKIIGGKTGYTEESLGCFILVVKSPNGEGYVANVILGSGDRFGEMEKLLSWLKKSYRW